MGSDSPSSQFVGVPPRTTADIEHAVAGPEAEYVDEEVDLLHRPLGEGIAEVGRPGVLGDVFEPVLDDTSLAR